MQPDEIIHKFTFLERPNLDEFFQGIGDVVTLPQGVYLKHAPTIRKEFTVPARPELGVHIEVEARWTKYTPTEDRG